MPEVVIRRTETSADIDTVRQLCWEYRDYLLTFSAAIRPMMETFYPKDAYAVLMADLPVKHARPRGVILLAEIDGEPVGCGMTHALNAEDVEVKRVFVRDVARGTGAGARLSQALVDQARADGFKRVLLDTAAQFTHAQKLYEKLGFQARGPYSDLPPGTEDLLVFYEYVL